VQATLHRGSSLTTSEPSLDIRKVAEINDVAGIVRFNQSIHSVECHNARDRIPVDDQVVAFQPAAQDTQ
jgi:uncharacterized Fe-S cluster-containing radical SAM superfamily enzyme